jgi:hypothetical protein
MFDDHRAPVDPYIYLTGVAMNQKRKALLIVAPLILALTGCTTIPDGPSVMVLPGSGVSFEIFQADDRECQQFALERIGQSPNQMALEAGARSAALGAVLGTVAGATIDGGRGAAVGAGTGLAIGGMTGAGSSPATGYAAQKRFDNAYIQCMFAKGHRVPISGNFSETRPVTRGGLTSPQQSFPPPNTRTPPPAEYITSDQAN